MEIQSIGNLFVIVLSALLVSVSVCIYLAFSKFSRSDFWTATVTPLASIIGSGFLVCAPILAREFGIFAAPAMLFLLILAYAVGSVIRFNIRHVEPYIVDKGNQDSIIWLARVAQSALALAYAISVAYYLKLLAAFLFRGNDPNSILYSKCVVTCIILICIALALTGGLRRVEHLAHATVSIKLGVISGMLTALALWWLNHLSTPVQVPIASLSFRNFFVLLGLLITVQGFETSRYLGNVYTESTRIRSMLVAQWISSAIYIAFLLLLTPFLSQASRTQGVAGILDIMKSITPFMGGFVLLGAVMSQLSAAVADSIGGSGIAVEASRQRLSIPKGYAMSSGLSIAVVWLTNPFQVIALASRAFAVYYSLQCLLALLIHKKSRIASKWLGVGFAFLGIVCVLAAIAGSPAE